MRGLTTVLAAMLVGASAPALGADEQPICADRPSKSTGPCTVPQGKWQIETGLIDWSRDTSEGVTTNTIVWANTAIKYGISDKADIELWLTPLETQNMHGSGVSERHSSFGDTLVRMKYALSPNNSPVQLTLDPFVKIPTANHVFGNGKVEGGLLVPIQIALGKGPFSLSLDPELDVAANQSGHHYHLATQQVLNLGIQATDKLNLSTEVWASWDWDPEGTTSQVSWDASAAYFVTKDLQLDGGANFGLNHQTPGIELYTGISYRF